METDTSIGKTTIQPCEPTQNTSEQVQMRDTEELRKCDIYKKEKLFYNNLRMQNRRLSLPVQQNDLDDTDSFISKDGSKSNLSYATSSELSHISFENLSLYEPIEAVPDARPRVVIEPPIYENVTKKIPEKPKRKFPPKKGASLKSLPSEKYGRDDYNVIRDIVVDKYSDVLDRFRERSYQRNNQKRNEKWAAFVNDNQHLFQGLPSPISFNDCDPEFDRSPFTFQAQNQDYQNVVPGDYDDDSFDCKSFMRRALGDDYSNGRSSLDRYSKGEQDDIEDLHKELSIQEETIMQISKAINFCYNSKQFVYSIEHIEAERLLLVASRTKEQLLKALNGTTAQTNVDNGFVRISQIVIPFRSIKREVEESMRFVCVISSGTKVLASELLKAENDVIKIPKDFIFRKLSNLFDIVISIYNIKLEDKTKVKKSNKINYLTPKKLFKIARDRRMKQPIPPIDEIRSTSFVLWGQLHISKNNLKENSFKLSSMNWKSILDETVFMNLESDAYLISDTNGFLSLATYATGALIWNRKWCQLEGSRLYYYNYPTDAEILPPLGVIDFQYCSSKVQTADRSLCARQKSLQLEIKQDDVVTIYFLSFDTTEEMKKWQEKFDYVTQILQDWNCLP